MILTTLTPVTVDRDRFEEAISYWSGVLSLAASPIRRLTSSGLLGATTGPLIILTGPDDAREEAARVSVVLVADDLQEQRDRAIAAGAVDLPLLDGASSLRCHLRHPDNTVTELIQAPGTTAAGG